MNDLRLDNPTFHRNHQAIAAGIAPHIGKASGNAIEVGSGSGQHAVAFAREFPALTWWPTEPDPRLRDSIDAWRRDSGLENLMPPAALDASSTDWNLGASGRPSAECIDLFIAINVLHITPWPVSEGLFAGAGRHLTPHGHLCLYGPFARGGRHSAESNRQFDASLQMQNPEWGVRDVDDLSTLAQANGMSLIDDVAMPRDNSVLVFRAEP